LALQLIDRRTWGLDGEMSILDAIYLMEDAWGNCYTFNNFKLFQKSRFLSGNVSVNNKTVTESEHAFLE
jgi:hypothetical protein